MVILLQLGIETAADLMQIVGAIEKDANQGTITNTVKTTAPMIMGELTKIVILGGEITKEASGDLMEYYYEKNNTIGKNNYE